MRQSSLKPFKSEPLLVLRHLSNQCKLRLTDVAYKAFMDSIETQGRALLRIPLDLTDADVTPPLAILDHVQILREIMAVYGPSISDTPPTDADQAAFERILDVMLDPAMQMCDAAAEEKKRVRPLWDREVFGLNCWSYLLVSGLI